MAYYVQVQPLRNVGFRYSLAFGLLVNVILAASQSSLPSTRSAMQAMSIHSVKGPASSKLEAAGSGTTLAAAELTERVCYGLELDPKYVDVVVQRWQTLAGKQATLEGDGRTFEEIAQQRRTEAA